MTKLKLLATTAVAAISISTSAMAFPINYEFSGHITNVSYGTPPAGVGVGSLFSGTLSLDSNATTVSSQYQIDNGVYDYRGSNFNLTVGSISLYQPNPLIEFSLGTGSLQSVYFGGNTTSLADGSSPGSYLFDTVSYTFSTPGLVTQGPMTTIPGTSAFDINNFGLTEYALAPGYPTIFQIAGTTDEMHASTQSAVPEPSTALLLAFPLLAFGMYRNKLQLYSLACQLQ